MRKNTIVGLIIGLLAAMGASLAGPAQGTGVGNEGCTPGYWKNHTQSWQEYSPTTVVGTVFSFSAAPADVAAFSGTTFEAALRLKGGSGLGGATQILLRAAVSATLNAAHNGVGYPLRRSGPNGIFAQVNAALASGDRQVMLDLATKLDNLNNLGCPLS